MPILDQAFEEASDNKAMCSFTSLILSFFVSFDIGEIAIGLLGKSFLM
jgi:hypothetical protein